MTNEDRFLAYLHHYAARDLAPIEEMLAPDVHLRDWTISVHGKQAVLDETARNFAASRSIDIDVRALYESSDSVAGELRILVDDAIELFVVDVVTFDDTGLVTAIRSYRGLGD